MSPTTWASTPQSWPSYSCCWMLHLPKVESTEAAHIWQRSPRQPGGRMTTLDRYGKSSISPLTKHILAIDLPFLYVTLLTDRRPYPPPLQSIRGLTEALSTIMIIHPWTDRSPYLPSWYSAQYCFEPGNSLSSKKKYNSKHTHTQNSLVPPCRPSFWSNLTE